MSPSAWKEISTGGWQALRKNRSATASGSESASTLPCETNALHRVKRVPGFTGALAAC
jgi:hypothetical protein